MNGIVFTTKNYCRNQKCNDSVVCVSTDSEIVFGSIVKFESNDNNVAAIIKIFETTKLHDNFYIYNKTSNLKKIVLNENVQKCQIFNINQSNYLTIVHYYLLVD